MKASGAQQSSQKRVSNDDDKASRGNLSRDEILRVSAQIFREKGYRATNLQQVADYFGVRRPAIYYWFSRKADILVEIQKRFLDTLTKELESILALDLPTDEKLIRIMTGQVEMFAGSIAELAVFLENESELPEDAQQETQSAKRRYQKAIEELYRKGIKEGIFVDMDPHVAASLLLGLTNWMHRWYRPGHHAASEIADVITRFACDGILVNGKPRK